MYADSDIVPNCIVRPGSFGGLMALYEANYLKLDWLVGDVTNLRGSYRSTSKHDCDAFLTVEDRSRYTSSLFLTYQIETEGDTVVTPGLELKAYEDARLVEVMRWYDIEENDVLMRLRGERGRELDRRWACNVLLGKWLDYLIDMEHVFASDSRQSAHAGHPVSRHVFA